MEVAKSGTVKVEEEGDSRLEWKCICLFICLLVCLPVVHVFDEVFHSSCSGWRLTRRVSEANWRRPAERGKLSWRRSSTRGKGK